MVGTAAGEISYRGDGIAGDRPWLTDPSALGKSFDECVQIGPERPGKDTAYSLDSLKLRTELGWRDTFSLQQGIDDVIAWAERFVTDIPKLPAKYEHKP